MLLVKDGNALADGLVVIDLGDTRDEIANVELLLKFEVKNLSVMEKFDIDVGFVGLDLIVDAIEISELVSRHGVAKSLFLIRNQMVTVVTAAHGALLNDTILVLKHPSLGRAELAIELIAVGAVELDVLKVKL